MLPVVRVIDPDQLIIVFYDDFEEDLRKFFISPAGQNPKYKDYDIAAIKSFRRKDIESIIFLAYDEREKKKKKKK